MKTGITTVLLAVSLLAVITGTALAGVKPEPFRLSIQRLDVVETNIGGLSTMIDAVMGVVPEPFCPTPDSVMAEEFRDLAKQMQRIEDEVVKTLVHPPEPGMPEEVFCTVAPNGEVNEGLKAVRAATMGIITKVNRFLVNPPDDSKILNAMDKLVRNSKSLVEMIDMHLAPGTVIDPGDY